MGKGESCLQLMSNGLEKNSMSICLHTHIWNKAMLTIREFEWRVYRNYFCKFSIDLNFLKKGGEPWPSAILIGQGCSLISGQGTYKNQPMNA